MLILQEQARTGVLSMIFLKNNNLNKKIMKNLKYILIIISTPVLLYSCTDKKNGNNSQNGNQMENQFSSADDAVAKGKNDLLAILKNKQFTINIDSAALKRSQPETPIPLYEVSFDRLLKSNGDSLITISTDSKKWNIPLVDKNKIVATIATSKNEKGWQIDEVANPSISNDLNEIRASLNTPNMLIKVYEVPNINATLYETKIEGRNMYFTKYNGQSLRQPVAADVIFNQLKTDALVFQRRFGEQLKKGKLVK